MFFHSNSKVTKTLIILGKGWALDITSYLLEKLLPKRQRCVEEESGRKKKGSLYTVARNTSKKRHCGKQNRDFHDHRNRMNMESSNLVSKYTEKGQNACGFLYCCLKYPRYWYNLKFSKGLNEGGKR